MQRSIFKTCWTQCIIASTLKPVGLTRDDGKRPDGTILAPWSKGQRLVWDVTCFILQFTNRKSGATAKIACNRKHVKYVKIKSVNFRIVGLAFETLGSWCKESRSFLTVGKLLIAESVITQEVFYGRIEQGNAEPIRTQLDKIYKL